MMRALALILLLIPTLALAHGHRKVEAVKPIGCEAIAELMLVMGKETAAHVAVAASRTECLK